MMSWAEKQLKMNDEHHFFSECSQTSQLTKIQRMQLNVLLNDIATGYFFKTVYNVSFVSKENFD